jgi:hypothetical protein
MKKIENLKDTIKLQSQNGNYNYDEYNYGLLNGLIVALSILENKEPIFPKKPKKWLKNVKITAKPVEEKKQ